MTWEYIRCGTIEGFSYDIRTAGDHLVGFIYFPFDQDIDTLKLPVQVQHHLPGMVGIKTNTRWHRLKGVTQDTEALFKQLRKVGKFLDKNLDLEHTE